MSINDELAAVTRRAFTPRWLGYDGPVGAAPLTKMAFDTTILRFNTALYADPTPPIPKPPGPVANARPQIDIDQPAVEISQSETKRELDL